MATAYVRDLGKIRTTGAGLASSASFGTAPAVGNHIVSTIACYKSGDTTYTMSTSDNKSNSYTSHVSARESYSGGEGVCNIGSCKIATAGGTFTVTATASGSGVAYHSWSAAEFSGMHATTWLDRTGSIVGTPGVNVTSLTVTTSANLTAADELAVSALALYSFTNHGSIAATGYTNLFSEGDTTTYMGGAGAYKLISGGSGATHSAAWSWTTNVLGSAAVIATFIPAAGGGYSITAAQGSYALTGQAAGVRTARKLVAAQGSYALTGQVAGLKRGYRLAAAAGAYALSGQAAVLRAARRLVAAAGSYALSGQAVTLTYTLARSLVAAAGSYALTGQAVVLRLARKLVVAVGTYNLSGIAVGLSLDGAAPEVSRAGGDRKFATLRRFFKTMKL